MQTECFVAEVEAAENQWLGPCAETGRNDALAGEEADERLISPVWTASLPHRTESNESSRNPSCLQVTKPNAPHTQWPTCATQRQFHDSRIESAQLGLTDAIQKT